MKGILIMVLAVVLATVAQGQTHCLGNAVPAFCEAADPAVPDWNINDFDPVRDADDWCKLACNQPHKAKRQLSKAVALVRSENNLNRYYFTKQGTPGVYIQLLRPWMQEQNRTQGTNWRGVGHIVDGNETTMQIWDVCNDYPCSKTPSYYEIVLRHSYGFGGIAGPYHREGDYGGTMPAISYDLMEVVKYDARGEDGEWPVWIGDSCRAVPPDWWPNGIGLWNADIVKQIVEGYLDYIGGAIDEPPFVRHGCD